MKKAIRKLFGIVILGGAAYLVSKLAKKDEVQDTLFDFLGEDTYLAVQDKAYLLGDLLMWPIDYIRALLP
jgi:hypothetical protein